LRGNNAVRAIAVVRLRLLRVALLLPPDRGIIRVMIKILSQWHERAAYAYEGTSDARASANPADAGAGRAINLAEIGRDRALEAAQHGSPLINETSKDRFDRGVTPGVLLRARFNYLPCTTIYVLINQAAVNGAFFISRAG